MDFGDLVRMRRMARSFTGEPVAPEVVSRILDVARRGPNAGYSQGVEFVLVTDPALREAIAVPGQEILAASGHRDFVSQARYTSLSVSARKSTVRATRSRTR